MNFTPETSFVMPVRDYAEWHVSKLARAMIELAFEDIDRAGTRSDSREEFERKRQEAIDAREWLENRPSLVSLEDCCTALSLALGERIEAHYVTSAYRAGVRLSNNAMKRYKRAS